MRLYFEAYTERGLTFGGIFLIADFNSIDETCRYSNIYSPKEAFLGRECLCILHIHLYIR